FTGLPGELRLTGIESHVSPDGAAWEMGAGPPSRERVRFRMTLVTIVMPRNLAAPKTVHS
ncbi:MAG: hypothetical protein WCC85_10940, partial [Candidatus Sulfotelmatobacter sp.]